MIKHKTETKVKQKFNVLNWIELNRLNYEVETFEDGEVWKLLTQKHTLK